MGGMRDRLPEGRVLGASAAPASRLLTAALGRAPMGPCAEDWLAIRRRGPAANARDPLAPGDLGSLPICDQAWMCFDLSFQAVVLSGLRIPDDVPVRVPPAYIYIYI